MNPTAVSPSFPHPGPDFDRNRDRLPTAERDKWTGKHVAWSWDGTHIIAGADALADLITELRRLKVDPSTVVFDFLDLPDAPA
jgi:hypothetical protein